MRVFRSARPLCIAASFLLLGPWLRPATGQLQGPAFQVNSYTTDQQSSPSIASNGSGDFLVVWASQGQDGSEAGVFGQVLNSLGLPVGGEFLVNTYTTNRQYSQALASNGQSNFVVVWHSYPGQDGSRGGVFGRRFDSTGTALGAEFQVNSYTTNWQRSPKVAADASGNFVVVWESYPQDGDGTGIFGQRFDAAGSPIGSEFQVNTYTTNWQRNPSVAMDGPGNFIVVWQSYQQDGSRSGVFGQGFNSLGTPAGSEFQVNNYTTGEQIPTALAANAAGEFVAVWASPMSLNLPEGELYGRRIDLEAGPLGIEFQVNGYTSGSQGAPTLAINDFGNFVVAWSGNGENGESNGVFGQWFGPAGDKLRGEFQVNSYTTNSQAGPTVAVGGSGNFIVTWSSYAQDGDGSGVFGQRLTTWLFIDGFEAANTCAWSASVGGVC